MTVACDVRTQTKTFLLRTCYISPTRLLAPRTFKVPLVPNDKSRLNGTVKVIFAKQTYLEIIYLLRNSLSARVTIFFGMKFSFWKDWKNMFLKYKYFSKYFLIGLMKRKFKFR